MSFDNVQTAELKIYVCRLFCYIKWRYILISYNITNKNLFTEKMLVSMPIDSIG